MTMTCIQFSVDGKHYTREELYNVFKYRVVAPVKYSTFYYRLQGLKPRVLSHKKLIKLLTKYTPGVKPTNMNNYETGNKLSELNTKNNANNPMCKKWM